jgi:hypothetical protein
MIPREIKRKHILQAIESIDRVPPGRQSRKFFLLQEGKRYPPKYVVSLACEFATGKRLGSNEFGGGVETNAFLARLGFDIVDKHGATAAPTQTKNKTKSTKTAKVTGHQRKHCKACKQQVARFLKTLYGRVEEGKSFRIPAHRDALTERYDVPVLGQIHEALVSFRGHGDFVGQKQLPACDYFVPDPGFVLEFDERQHFTAPRKLALERYDPAAAFGFSVQRWANRCERMDAHDNDPRYRDEQRAWYDTLRDFLPRFRKGMLPTVRIMDGERPWCQLDPDSEEDRAQFRDWAGLPCRFQIQSESTGDAEPYWGRVIIQGPWYGGVVQARRLLDAVCDQWPSGVRTRMLVTSGGFVSFEWPLDLTRKILGNNREPEPATVARMFQEAERAVEDVLTPTLRSKLSRYTDAVTLGVDSFKTQVSVSSARIKDLHAELVCLLDLRTNRTHWTGKTYPTVGQERGLVRITDVDSHFATLDGETVFLLGCHDLNAFSPRGNSRVRRRWRKETIRALQGAVKKRAPTNVIHHPHTTDTPRIWKAAWNKLLATAGSVSRYASAGRYHRSSGPCRAPLDKVLPSTVHGSAFNLVVRLP